MPTRPEALKSNSRPVSVTLPSLVISRRDWPTVMSNLKGILRPGGLLLLTTRSKGFKYHAYPYDFWRYEPADLRAMFSDLEIVTIEQDTDAPGVFMLASRPEAFAEQRSPIRLYSMITGRRERSVSDRQHGPRELGSARGRRRVETRTALRVGDAEPRVRLLDAGRGDEQVVVRLERRREERLQRGVRKDVTPRLVGERALVRSAARRAAERLGNRRVRTDAPVGRRAPGEEDEVSVVLTRSHARELDLDAGSKVWLTPNRGARTVPVLQPKAV